MSAGALHSSAGPVSEAEAAPSLREAPRPSPSRAGRLETWVATTLAIAGVELDGSAPHDIRVRDPRFFAAVAGRGSLGLGESYMAGWWECPRIDELVFRLLRAGLHREARRGWREAARTFAAFVLAPGRRSRAFEIGERHYDLGNDLFERMLDRRMVYSCASWRAAKTLDAAQEAKLDLVCRKVGLRPGMRVLDIGCGWGGFVRFAAERYGVRAHGITVSRQQLEVARRRAAGFPVEVELLDYRALGAATYDAIVSIGMFEHVGPRNHATFLEVVRRCLAPDGLFLLHTIGGSESTTTADPWIERYVFPNSVIPSLAQITRAAEGRFVVEDLHSFGADYDRTLLAWNENVERRRSELKDRYDERFFRMWRYYLLSCAGSFRARHNHLWQLVLSPRGLVGGYDAPR